jgi:hypothetical protein
MLYFVALYLAPLPSDAPVAPQRAMLTPESKKGLAFLLDPLIYWLPFVDSFRNELADNAYIRLKVHWNPQDEVKWLGSC